MCWFKDGRAGDARRIKIVSLPPTSRYPQQKKNLEAWGRAKTGGDERGIHFGGWWPDCAKSDTVIIGTAQRH